MGKPQTIRLKAAEIAVYEVKEVEAPSLGKAVQALKNELKQNRLKPKKTVFSIRE